MDQWRYFGYVKSQIIIDLNRWKNFSGIFGRNVLFIGLYHVKNSKNKKKWINKSEKCVKFVICSFQESHIDVANCIKKHVF